MTIEQLAKRAYDAYGATTDHKNYQGNPMPKWEELPEKIQQAWIAAATQVRADALRPLEDVAAPLVQPEVPRTSGDTGIEPKLHAVLDWLIAAIKALKAAETARDAAALVRASQDAQRYQKALRDGLEMLHPYREDLLKTVTLYLHQKEELERAEAKLFPMNIFA